jgi:hypothetical protein
MIIALIVLSSILLFLIIGLIFKRDFREDVLKAGAENEAEIKGVKIKGALFWVIYALTAIGTIYIALNLEPKLAPLKAKPLLESTNGHNWMALDLEEVTPLDLRYGYEDSLLVKASRKKALDLRMKVDSTLRVRSVKSDFVFGEISKQSLSLLGLSDNIYLESYNELRYKLILNPLIATLDVNHIYYDAVNYHKLPFKITVNYDSNNGLHTQISPKESQTKLTLERVSFTNEKWVKITPVIDGNIYLIRLKAIDTNPNNGKDKPEFASFQILKFNWKTTS